MGGRRSRLWTVGMDLVRYDRYGCTILMLGLGCSALKDLSVLAWRSGTYERLLKVAVRCVGLLPYNEASRSHSGKEALPDVLFEISLTGPGHAHLSILHSGW